MEIQRIQVDHRGAVIKDIQVDHREAETRDTQAVVPQEVGHRSRPAKEAVVEVDHRPTIIFPQTNRDPNNNRNGHPATEISAHNRAISINGDQFSFFRRFYYFFL